SKTSRTLPLRSFSTPGRSTIDCASICITILCHGWNRRQTKSANSSRPRLGLFQRSPENFRKTERRRYDFAQGRARQIDRERDLQFQIADYGTPVFAAAAGP